jgi:hypothetical protein
MRHTVPLVTASLALLLLGGCGEDMSRTFGLQRESPDEFQVTTRAPLSMPPSYALAAPRPGASRPQEQTTRDAAEAVLVPQAAIAAADSAPMSPATAHIVQAAGPAAPADIRTKVEQESSMERAPRNLADRLMFWRSPPPAGIPVDPQREQQRLRENAALGQSVEVGNTPIIQPKQKSWIDRLMGT